MEESGSEQNNAEDTTVTAVTPIGTDRDRDPEKDTIIVTAIPIHTATAIGMGMGARVSC